VVSMRVREDAKDARNNSTSANATISASDSAPRLTPQ